MEDFWLQTRRNLPANSTNVKINFNHPIKELIWISKRKANETEEDQKTSSAFKLLSNYDLGNFGNKEDVRREDSSQENPTISAYLNFNKDTGNFN